MKNFWLKIGAIALSLIAIIGYQWGSTGDPPNLSNFASGVTCKSEGNTVTVTAATGEQVVITFPLNSTRSTASEPTALLYYEKPTPNAKVAPLSLIKYLTKYEFIVNFARDCLLPYIPQNVESRN